MRTVSFLFLLILNTESAVPQWTTPQAVDTAAIFLSQGRIPLCIAVGPQRDVAVVLLRRDTLVFISPLTTEGVSLVLSLPTDGVLVLVVALSAMWMESASTVRQTCSFSGE